jgi:hypothetical protein
LVEVGIEIGVEIEVVVGVGVEVVVEVEVEVGVGVLVGVEVEEMGEVVVGVGVEVGTLRTGDAMKHIMITCAIALIALACVTPLHALEQPSTTQVVYDCNRANLKGEFDKVTHEVLTRFDVLAEKLGVAAGQIWQIYVAQAKVEGIKYLASGVVGLLPLAIYLYFAKRFWVWDLDAGFNKNGSGGIFAGFATMIALISGGLALINLFASLTPLLNPQYWAFQQIVSQLK